MILFARGEFHTRQTLTPITGKREAKSTRLAGTVKGRYSRIVGSGNAYKGHVNLGFNRGTLFPDLHRVLAGTGKLVRRPCCASSNSSSASRAAASQPM